MRFTTSVLAATAATVLLAACADDPYRDDAAMTRIALAPGLDLQGVDASDGIVAVRLSFDGLEGARIYDGKVQSVDPGASEWALEMAIPLSQPVDGYILAALMSRAGDSYQTEYTIDIGPVHLEPRTATTISTDTVEFSVVRGPLANASVTSVAITPVEDYVGLGQTRVFRAALQGGGTGARPLWRTSDDSVVVIQSAAGDSVTLLGVGEGYAMLYAEAGSAADTAYVYVTPPAGPLASVYVYPDSALVPLGGVYRFYAAGADTAGTPVFPTFTWTSLDPGTASVTQDGVVSGLALGTARIVVSAGAFADTARAVVDSIPQGIGSITWVGGAVGAENDWFTADNWMPVRVPTTADSVYVPSNRQFYPTLGADVTIARLETAYQSDGYGFVDLGDATLTVTGDVVAEVFGSTTSLVVIDAPAAKVGGYLPRTSLNGGATVVDFVGIEGGLSVDGGAGEAEVVVPDTLSLAVYGDLSMKNAHFRMGEGPNGSSLVYVEGSATFDGGDATGAMLGGTVYVGGDFTVTAASCSAYTSDSTWTSIYADSALTVDVACGGPNGNHFGTLELYSDATAASSITLATDLHVADYLYLSSARLVGSPAVLSASTFFGYSSRLDDVYLALVGADASDDVYADSLTFVNMSDQTRAQISVTNTEGSFSILQSTFDTASASPYVEAVDADGAAPFLDVFAEYDPGDGPNRTVTSGGATVTWSTAVAGRTDTAPAAASVRRAPRRAELQPRATRPARPPRPRGTADAAGHGTVPEHLVRTHRRSLP